MSSTNPEELTHKVFAHICALQGLYKLCTTIFYSYFLVCSGGKIKTGCFCMGNQSIVSASSDGSICVFR